MGIPPSRILTAFLVLALTVLVAPFATHAQPTDRPARVGVLSSRAGPAHLDEIFRQTLRALGWVEGQNLVIEYRWAGGSRERLTQFATELAAMNVDVIFAAVTDAASAARRATSTIPIVFATPSDPIGAGLAVSFGRPGGNATGLSSLPGDGFVGKQLQLLKETVPGASRVAVLWNSTNPGGVKLVREAEGLAASLGLRLLVQDAPTPDALDPAFEILVRERTELLLVLADPMFFVQRVRLADLAATRRLPALYGLREHPEAGGLMSYGASFSHLFRRAAVYVDRILRGAKPAELPIERPEKLEFVINVRSARALGLTIPPALLLRADQLIE